MRSWALGKEVAEGGKTFRMRDGCVERSDIYGGHGNLGVRWNGSGLETV